MLHLGKYSRCEKHTPQPTEEAQDFGIRWLVDRLKPAICEQPDDFLERSHFDRVLKRIDMRSSPGLPLCHQYPTNGDFLTDGKGNLIPQRVETLWTMVQARLNGAEAYPLRVFIKQEPHKIGKLEEGRLRLIMAVSLVDAVLDHMIFGWQNDAQIEKFAQIPCAPGWGVTHGGWRHIPSDGFSTDKKAWDWGVPWWLLYCDLVARKNNIWNLTAKCEYWMDKRFNELFKTPVFQLSSGHRFTQEFAGVVKTGSVITISTNTDDQGILHGVGCFESGMPADGHIIFMGDDVIQDKITEDYLKALKKYVRVEEGGRGEFCSFKFHPGGRVEPMRWGKHLTNLLYVKERDLEVFLTSMQVNYALSRRLPRVRQLVMELCPSAFLSDIELKHIME